MLVYYGRIVKYRLTSSRQYVIIKVPGDLGKPIEYGASKGGYPPGKGGKMTDYELITIFLMVLGLVIIRDDSKRK